MPLSKRCQQCGATYFKKNTQSMRNWTERSKFCSKTCIAKFFNNGKLTRFKEGNKLAKANKGKRAWNKMYSPEQLKEKQRQWSRESYARYKENHSKEERQKRVRKWLKDNPDRAKAINQRSYQNNKARFKKHKFLRRIREAYNGGHFSEKEWQELIKKFNYRCLRCGEAKPLSADHIVPIVDGGTNEISNIQPLCVACNCSKGRKQIDYR